MVGEDIVEVNQEVLELVPAGSSLANLYAGEYTVKQISSIPLQKAYGFEPVFPGLEEQYQSRVKGLGAQVWTCLLYTSTGNMDNIPAINFDDITNGEQKIFTKM